MAIVEERSAGMLVFYNPTGRRGGEEFLLLDYGQYWDYPKGHVEGDDEDDLAAAKRELREETGIGDVAVMPGFRREIVYFFRSKRGLVRKQVTFFLARADPRPTIALSHEHTDHVWLRYPQALERLTYASAKDVLRAARAFLDEG